jgi:hypothetical protein
MDVLDMKRACRRYVPASSRGRLIRVKQAKRPQPGFFGLRAGTQSTLPGSPAKLAFL